jgi:hypothetical protein
MAFTQGHALLIGVGSYVHAPRLNVPITVRDAKAIQKVLLDPRLCGYPAAQVNRLSDQDATRTGILAALDQLAAQTTADNTVLVFYAGHGDYGTDGNYYLTSYDTQISKGKIAAGTGITDAEILDKLRKISAKRLLLFFNACHSGEISPALNTADDERVGSLSLPPQSVEAILSSGEGRIIITACRPDQFSSFPHGEDKLTYFTQALVDGLGGKGTVSKGGYVSAFNLYEYLYWAVKEVNEAFGQMQEPELTVLKGVGPFPVALYRGASSLSTFDEQEPLPEETATRQVEPARSQRYFKQIIRNVAASGDGAVAIGGSANGAIINTGGGAVAKGNNNTVVGAGGVHVGGSVGGDIVTGKKITQTAGDDAIQIGQARVVKITKDQKP